MGCWAVHLALASTTARFTILVNRILGAGFCLFVVAVLLMEPSISHMQARHSTTEPLHKTPHSTLRFQVWQINLRAGPLTQA